MPLRDTDSDWRKIGGEQPFWGVLSGDRYRTENITDTALDDFYSSGHSDIELVVQRITRMLGNWPTPRKALDFGCGVGRLAFAMAHHAGEVIGYDVSLGMLQKAKARGDAAVVFTSDWPTFGFDWINSYIVFQHIDPARGISLLENLLRLLNPGGLISLHFTIYRDAELEDARPTSRLLEAVAAMLGRRPAAPIGAVSMFDYDLDKIFRAITRSGIDETTMFHVDHEGHHGVQLIGRRGLS